MPAAVLIVQLARCGLLVSLMLGMGAISGCSTMSKFYRFFVAPDCEAGAPVKEQEYELVVRDIPMDGYYAEVRASAPTAPLEVLAEIDVDGTQHPIHLIGPVGPGDGPRILVVAGVHGNEIAGTLAVPQILERHAGPDGAAVDLYLVTPANPVGIVYQSRFNAEGCDVNRDFGPFRTPEARAIAAAISQIEPDVIVSLHEGPGDGIFVIATRSAPPGSAEAMIAVVDEVGLDISTVDLLGLSMDADGVMNEGWFLTFGKSLLSIDSLGAYAHGRGLGTLTVETRWDGKDIDARVAAQV
ncbi:MAG: DUF2817 domain-containing protein [Halioglobus sp.]|nr:DUF2817 domain-containing protein [Halioglobus sp.]